MVTTFPSHVPASIREQLGTDQGHRFRGNCSGADVFRVVSPQIGDCHLKILFSTSRSALAEEHAKLEWMNARLAERGGTFEVPQVVTFIQNGSWGYLVTRTLHGQPCHKVFEETPLRVARTMGKTLRALHLMDASGCPFDCTLAARLAAAESRVNTGKVSVLSLHDSTSAGETPEKRLKRLRKRPPQEEIVLTHGDFCLPNVVLDLDETVSLLDLGTLGLADRHRDLALAIRSLRMNHAMPDAIDTFLLWYGREMVDEDKLAYYMQLSDLAS